jgi:hypothetical protein
MGLMLLQHVNHGGAAQQGREERIKAGEMDTCHFTSFISSLVDMLQ